MGLFLSRQRYYDNNLLVVEIANGKKHTGADILPVKWDEPGLCEGRYLVNPVDAVSCAINILEKWNLSTADEKKFICLVNGNDDGKGTKHIFDPHSSREMERLARWADETFKAMTKCSHCQKPISSSLKTFEINDLPKQVYDTEACLASAYRHFFGKEPPRVEAAKQARRP